MVKMVTHEEIKKYIQGNIDEALSEQVSTIRKESTLYQVLFALIDQIDGKYISEVDISIDQKELNFSEIELLLEEIISGSAHLLKQRRFFELLYHSPNHYSRLVTKINQISPLLDTSEAAELSEVAIKSDEEILASIKGEVCGDIKVKHSPMRQKSTVLVKPKNIWTMPAVRRFVYAAAAVLLILSSFNFINDQYKTTFKNYTAQNILQENYRIYITEQPRISGGFHSTGISQLMAGEDDSLDYLDEANEMINEVLNYELNEKRALHLQAQIMIIQNQYQKADSILNIALNQEIQSQEMLNDRGVIYFGKKDWQKAKTFFKLSIKQDPTYAEAYYNLALTEINLGNKKETKEAVDLFLKYEKDPGWKNAGLNMLNTMEGDIQM